MKWWQRFFKKEKLEGSEQLSLKDRISALRNLPRFFRLVWQSSPGMMLANFILRILRSSIPVAVLYVGKLIIDGILHVKDNSFAQNLLWQWVAIEFGLLILSDALGRIISLF